MNVDSKVEIEESKASIMLSPGYMKWNTPNERGRFPLSMSWKEAKIKDDKVKLIGVFGAKNNGKSMPDINFDFSLTSGQLKPQVQNTDKIINARVISAKRTEENSAKVFLPGNYECFSAKINIGGNGD